MKYGLLLCWLDIPLCCLSFLPFKNSKNVCATKVIVKFRGIKQDSPNSDD